MAAARPRLTTEQRRARLGVRHLLAPRHRVTDAVAAADGVVALHATDPASVYLSAAARLRAPDAETIAAVLYDERRLVKLLGMRRTVFTVSRDVAPLVQWSSAVALAPVERRKLLADLTKEGVADAEAFLAAAETEVVAVVRQRGHATGAEISKAVPALQQKLTGGLPVAANVSTRVLFGLGVQGVLMRGRPRGTWVSSQHEWTLADTWLPDGLGELDPATARAELVRRWLARFGPGTEADVKWWTGWTLGNVRAALATVAAVTVDLDDGAVGYVLPDDTAPVKAPAPWAALLPSLDPTAMGWQGREWYLGPHRAPLFDYSGNIGPTVWWNGRIVGGWAQTKAGTVVWRALEDVGADAVGLIEREVERTRAFLGATRVSPRFPTPLQRELTG
jgi:hypothetical protein